MEKNKTILCWGCSDEELRILSKNVPNNNIKIEEVYDFTDIIATPSFMVIINPTFLSVDELEECVNFYKDFTMDIPLFTNPCPVFDEYKVKYKLLEGDNFVRNIKYTIMDYCNVERKSVDYYNAITESLLILKAIKENPGVSTKQLARIIERSDRTVLRHINSLICACENIHYDKQKKGWYIPEGWSILVDDVAHMQYSKN